MLVGFGAELRSLARDGLEACLNAGHRAARVTRLTLQEVQASVLLQDGLWRAARVTGHVFLCRIQTRVKSYQMAVMAKGEKERLYVKEQ